MSSVITEREGNAIRYAVGYVCKKLRKIIEKSKHEYKEEMALCLIQLTKDNNITSCSSSEEWTVKINRGGLC